MSTPEEHLWFAAIVEHSLDAVFLTRPDGGILRANPAALRLFGYSLERLR